jgi:hypothetical protein
MPLVKPQLSAHQVFGYKPQYDGHADTDVNKEFNGHGNLLGVRYPTKIAKLI